MNNPIKKLLFLIVFMIGCTGFVVSCSSTSENKNPGAGDDDNPIGGIDSTDTDTTQTDGEIDNFSHTLFTVIGDVPYNEEQKDGLKVLIDAHNDTAKSEFVVHVGDIKPGADPCVEDTYNDVSEMLKRFKAPTFVVLGDNEYNDCANPEEGLALWNTHFLHFNENWEFGPTVAYQEKRVENFAWVQNGVLFLGLNLVGSNVHDPSEWDERLADDADWVETQLTLHDEDIEAAVLFGHANMTEVGPEKFKIFTDRFRTAAKNFERPVLYMQGDGHFWFENRPWPERNILRVQIEGGANAVQVTVDADLENPFNFDREFLD